MHSMTAFARKERVESWGTLVWEIRSVNHRYLEPGFRLPDSFRFLEPDLRDGLRKQLQRGKVDCSLQFQAAVNRDAISVDAELVQRYVQAAEQHSSAAEESRADERSGFFISSWRAV